MGLTETKAIATVKYQMRLREWKVQVESYQASGLSVTEWYR